MKKKPAEDLTPDLRERLSMAPLDRGPDVTEVSTYDQIEERAYRVQALLVRLGIPLHRDSDLSTLLRGVARVAKDFREGSPQHEAEALVKAAEANRIASAILEVGEEPAARECLRRMTSGPMNNSVRGAAPGKDAFWEIELTAYLRSKGLAASLAEPDVVVEVFGERYPLACKKIHSEKGVETQVRRGVQQLERFGALGLVALSIDQLTPPSSIFVSTDTRTAGDHLAAINRDFIERNRPRLERFVSDRRCHGLLVMNNVVADLQENSPRLNSMSGTTIWTLSGPYHPTSPSFAEIVRVLKTR